MEVFEDWEVFEHCMWSTEEMIGFCISCFLLLIEIYVIINWKKLRMTHSMVLIHWMNCKENSIHIFHYYLFENFSFIWNRYLSENNLNRLTSQTFAGLKNIRTLMLRTNKLTSIKNDTFIDMNSLNTLSLHDNRIKCIAPGSFDRLQSLSAL